MADTCPGCGSEMKNRGPPMSAMGEMMWGRELEEYYCDNPRCSRFGR